MRFFAIDFSEMRMCKGLLLFFLSFFLVGLNCNAQVRNLDYYLSRGIENSPLLKDYQNQYLSGQLDSQQIRAYYKPQVTAVSNDMYAPVINGYGYDEIITNLGNYNAMVNVNQSFTGRKNIQAQLATVRLQNDSVRNAAKISEQDLARSITAQYIVTYGDMQQLKIYSDINAILNNEDTILRNLTQNNIYRQADYLTFKVTLQQQRLQLKQLAIQFHTDYATLNYLCGIYDTSTSVQLAIPDIQLRSLPDVHNSVFFRQYVIDSMKYRNDVSLLNYNYRPKVNAFVNGGYNTSLIYQSYKNFGGSVGLNVSVPIYDGHQRRLQYKKIMLAEDTRKNYQQFFTSQYSQQVAQLRQELQATEQLISDINEQIKYSETLIKVDGKLMETGDTKIADFVIAINNYLMAKSLLTQNTVSRMQIINQLNYWNH